jgi:threonine/homoserine/homoserine lactone efflux protein
LSLLLLLEGGAVGFSIAAPVGPIGALTIRRTLAQGQATGLATGLGAATADALYGAIASLGLTAVSDVLVAQSWWLRLIGGVFLVYLGARTFLARPAPADSPSRAPGLASAYASTFLLTLANPATILSFVGIFAGLGLGDARSTYAQAAAFVAGVFAGSALWWLMLSWSVARVRGNLSGGALRWVNRISGTVIAGFGVLALAAVTG